MTNNLRRIRIQNALISVYNKEGLEPLVRALDQLGIRICSTGGTLKFIQDLGIEATAVESLTGYPSILGGRVKTLHPAVFGGILARRDLEQDQAQLSEYNIKPIDLVIVDLYPFEDTLASGASDAEIIEKIDIGGISLIRAAAKNYKDVLIISHRNAYAELMDLLREQEGYTSLSHRKYFAAKAFNVSSHYDTKIFEYFNQEAQLPVFKISEQWNHQLRYGENPHQHAFFAGDPTRLPKQLHGKEISYNNLLDIESALRLIGDFSRPTVAIIKHTNPCGCASAEDVHEAWDKALAADPVSAFGGIIVTNREVDEALANQVGDLFFEVFLAPAFTEGALARLKVKKNRILLQYTPGSLPTTEFRSILNGVIFQERDCDVETPASLTSVTEKTVAEDRIEDLLFANVLVKHCKSNAIVLAKGGSMLASGIGQTSRVDSLKQAIDKARRFGFDLQGAVMASDAFFPFSDCVSLAAEAGIDAIIQPGGSIRDQESVDTCNRLGVAMVTTGTRHFRH